MQKGSVSPAAARKQKLGRKVIMYGRMSHAIEAKISKLQPSKKSVVAPVGMAFKKVIRNIGHGILNHKIISAAAVLLLLCQAPVFCNTRSKLLDCWFCTLSRAA